MLFENITNVRLKLRARDRSLVCLDVFFLCVRVFFEPIGVSMVRVRYSFVSRTKDKFKIVLIPGMSRWDQSQCNVCIINLTLYNYVSKSILNL